MSQSTTCRSAISNSVASTGPPISRYSARLYVGARLRRSSERTKFQAGHPTEEEDYSPVFLRLVAVLVARRVTTNTSSCVPFAEASYAADFILNQQNLLRMHNRLVKQERSSDMGRMISLG